MKRNYLIFTATLLLLSLLLTFGVFAEPTPELIDPSTLGQKYVWLSDNGDDTNDGLTAEKAVKTWARAAEILAGNGVMLIPDIFTYQTNPGGVSNYYTPYVKDATSLVIKGGRADGKSVFCHARKNISINNPITFDNLIYRVAADNAQLFANYKRLEFTSTVKTELNGGVAATADNRAKALCVYGGDDNKIGIKDSACTLILNGGTFNWVAGGTTNNDVYSSIDVTIGGNALILNRVYLGCMGEIGEVMANAPFVRLTINGGKVTDAIYLGCCAKPASEFANVKAPVTVKVTGGDFGSIYCSGTYTGLVTGKILFDLTELQGADATWVEAHIKNQASASGGVSTYLPGQQLPTVTTAATTEKTSEPTKPVTTEKTPAKTTEKEPGTTEVEPGTTETSSERKSGGCGAVLTLPGAALCIIALFGSCVTFRKEK